MGNLEELTLDEFEELCIAIQDLWKMASLGDTVGELMRGAVSYTRYRNAEKKLAYYILGSNCHTHNGFERFQSALRNVLRKDQTQTTSCKFEYFLFRALSDSMQFYSYEGSMADHYWKEEDKRTGRN